MTMDLQDSVPYPVSVFASVPIPVYADPTGMLLPPAINGTVALANAGTVITSTASVASGKLSFLSIR